MKILYLITRAERGGGQVHVLDLIRGFRQHCEIEVAAGEDGFLLHEARRLNVGCHVLPNLVQPIQPAKDYRALREIVALLRETRPDLIHTHTSKAGILGRLAAWICNVPAVFTAHTWCFAEGTSWKWKLLGAPCERVAALPGGPIINVSEANRELALKYRIAPARRLVTIHNGVPDTPADCVSAGAGSGATDVATIVMVARFAPQKNQAMLLDAAASLSLPFRIQFAGTGPTMEDIERKAAGMGIAEHVQFLGDRSDIADVLRRASIFALPTNWEGFPLSILEAMRAGLPIVATDVGGIREAVVDGENGFVTPRGDCAAFACALQRLLSDESLRLRMARRSRQMFEERFTAEHMFRRTFNVYRQAVSITAGEYEPSRVSENA
jgi:glycosyltransferase involved in cell wall biosynthesis